MTCIKKNCFTAITHPRIRLGKQLPLMLVDALVGVYATIVGEYDACILEHVHAHADRHTRSLTHIHTQRQTGRRC